jgi:hypothetical protein
MGKTKEKLRLNFQEAWFFNLSEVTTNGNSEVRFHPKQPRPAFLSLLAARPFADLFLTCVATRHGHTSGRHRPVQICRIQPKSVDQGDAEPGHWKPGRPHLDDPAGSPDVEAQIDQPSSGQPDLDLRLFGRGRPRVERGDQSGTKRPGQDRPHNRFDTRRFPPAQYRMVHCTGFRDYK